MKCGPKTGKCYREELGKRGGKERIPGSQGEPIIKEQKKYLRALASFTLMAPYQLTTLEKEETVISSLEFLDGPVEPTKYTTLTEGLGGEKGWCWGGGAGGGWGLKPTRGVVAPTDH